MTILSALACFTGTPVDWFVMIKFPSGTKYAYLDNRGTLMKNSTYEVSSLTDGALANTLKPAIAESFFFYNDENASKCCIVT